MNIHCTTTAHRFGRELVGVAAIAVVALAAGMLTNALRSQPLPLVYHSPAARLQSELTQLVSAPPFQSFSVRMIGLNEFRSMVEARSALILDARTAVFYRQGHVPGALNLSRDGFARDYVGLRTQIEKAKDGPIVVYCSGGDCHDSKMVAQALLSLGYSDVSVFAGGWEQWSAAGLPAEAQ